VRTEDAVRAAAAEAAESPYIRYLANGQAIEQIDAKFGSVQRTRAALALEHGSGATMGCAGIVGLRPSGPWPTSWPPMVCLVGDKMSPLPCWNSTWPS
jgi:hypothetical protein